MRKANPTSFPGSFFPRSLWGGEMKDSGNEVEPNHVFMTRLIANLNGFIDPLKSYRSSRGEGRLS